MLLSSSSSSVSKPLTHLHRSAPFSSLLSPLLQPASSSSTRLPPKTLLILSPPWLAHTQELDSLLSLLQDDSAARIRRFRRRKDALRPFLLLSPCLPACLAAGQSLTSRIFKRCRVLDRSSPASLFARQGGDRPSATGGSSTLVFWQAFLRAFLPRPPLLALLCSLSFPAAGSSKAHTTDMLSLVRSSLSLLEGGLVQWLNKGGVQRLTRRRHRCVRLPDLDVVVFSRGGGRRGGRHALELARVISQLQDVEGVRRRAGSYLPSFLPALLFSTQPTMKSPP